MNMKNMTYQKALISMGYRPMSMKQVKTKMWMKPLGFATVGCYKEENKLKFGLYCLGAQNQPLVWKTDEIDLEEFYSDEKLDIVQTIKYVETNLFSSTTPFSMRETSHYEFLTPMDNANIIANVIG